MRHILILKGIELPDHAMLPSEFTRSLDVELLDLPAMRRQFLASLEVHK